MKQQLIYWFFTASLSFNNRVQAQVTNVLIDTTSTISKSTPSQILAESNHPVFRPKAFMAPVALMTAGLLVQGQVSRRVQSEVLKHYPGFWSTGR
jgi:hypothetical protein